MVSAEQRNLIGIGVGQKAYPTGEAHSTFTEGLSYGKYISPVIKLDA
jgi:hypothetical protein